MKKYLVLISGVLMQMVLGSIYAWSELAARLSLEFGFTSAQTQLIYGTAIGLFAFFTIVTGRVLLKIGPRVLGLISALLYFASYLLASMFTDNYTLMFSTLGIGLGFAIGAGYVIPLSSATRWFPNNKGTVTGLAVMGFGGGAIAASWIIRFLISQGAEAATILLYLGILGGTVLVLASLVQDFPPESESKTSAPALRIGEVVGNFRFWSLAAVMFLATAGGLIVIGNVGEIASEMKVAVIAPLGVTVLAIGNSSGRLIWGLMMDKLGDKCVPISLLLMTSGFILVILSNSAPVLFIVGIFLCGFQFGASLVLYGAYCEKVFGPGAISTVYPMIFAAYGLAALVGPSLGGAVFDATGSYNQVLLLLSVLPLVSLVLFFFQKRSGVIASEFESLSAK